MLLHHIGEDIHILRIVRERLDGLPARERLEPELRRIAEEIFTIFGERLVAVPYRPVMHVSSVRAVGLVKGSS